jgi:hypothetical protein
LGGGTSTLQVTTLLTLLASGSDYCAQVVADDGGVPERSFYGTFRAGAPETTTSVVRSTGASTILIRGSVDANAQATTVRARYDTAASPFCTSSGASGSPTTSTESVSGGSANGSIDVSLAVGGLTPGAKLCLLLTATNGSGAANPFGVLEFVVGAPEVELQFDEGAGPTSVRTFADIWTAGQATTVHVEYAESDPTLTDFCANDGAFGAHGGTPNQALGAAAASVHASATLTGLDPLKG